uniref:Uncharacterized protein n=1 Tax=Chrysemys picta bellii TaxID=8478 RepID=A0A8C3I4G6_CHRPI
IIQSSQPSSLKLTCRAFLLHRVFAFLPCPLPPARAAIVVLRLLLGLEGVSWPGSGGSKNGGFSFLLLCEKATRRALSWGWGWGLLKRKHIRWPEPGFSRQSLMASHTSNTSQRGEPESRMSAARESHSRGGPSALGQAESSRWWRAPSLDRAKLRFAGGFRRIRSSAPTTSSVSGRLETSKRYVWPASVGESAGREKAKILSPCTAPPAELSGVSAPPQHTPSSSPTAHPAAPQYIGKRQKGDPNI